MHLVQLLLPLYDNAGNAFPEGLYEHMRRELTDRFGGLTAFTRAPAQGLWKNEGGTMRDEIVVVEVMTSDLDREWWEAIAFRWRRFSSKSTSSFARSQSSYCNPGAMFDD